MSTAQTPGLAQACRPLAAKLCPHSFLKSAGTSFLFLWNGDQFKQPIGQGKLFLESPAKSLLPASHCVGSGLSLPNREFQVLILQLDFMVEKKDYLLLICLFFFESEPNFSSIHVPIY